MRELPGRDLRSPPLDAPELLRNTTFGISFMAAATVLEIFGQTAGMSS
jgi:hypothetical protein